MLNYHSLKPTFKDLTPCSTWQQTSNHIHYPNIGCFSSKLVIRQFCLPNSKLCTQTSKKLYYQTWEGFTKVENSIWLQTSSHLKYYSYHIKNLATLSKSNLP